MRGIDWLKLVLCSSGRRLTCQASVDNPIFVSMGRHSSSPPLSFALKKAPEAGLGAFVAKQENLRGTGRLHALVHIFVARSNALAELADSISRYGRPFMQTDWLFCVLH